MIVFSYNLVHFIKERKGFLALLGKAEVYYYSGIFVALQLLFCVNYGVVNFVYIVRFLLVKADIALRKLLVQKFKAVDKRYRVGVKIVDDMTVAFIVRGICGIKQFCRAVVNLRKLGEFARVQLIGQHIAVHSLAVGKTCYAVDFVIAVQLGNQPRLFIVISRGNYDRKSIVALKYRADFVPRYLIFVFAEGGKVGLTVCVRTHIGEECARNRNNHKNRRKYVFCLYNRLAEHIYLRNKVFVDRLFHVFAEHNQKSGHERKYAEKRHEYRLDHNY